MPTLEKMPHRRDQVLVAAYVPTALAFAVDRWAAERQPGHRRKITRSAVLRAALAAYVGNSQLAPSPKPSGGDQ